MGTLYPTRWPRWGGGPASGGPDGKNRAHAVHESKPISNRLHSGYAGEAEDGQKRTVSLRQRQEVQEVLRRMKRLNRTPVVRTRLRNPAYRNITHNRP